MADANTNESNDANDTNATFLYVFLRAQVCAFCGHKPRDEMTRPIVNPSRECRIVFQNDCSCFHSHLQGIRLSVTALV